MRCRVDLADDDEGDRAGRVIVFGESLGGRWRHGLRNGTARRCDSGIHLHLRPDMAARLYPFLPIRCCAASGIPRWIGCRGSYVPYWWRTSG